MLLNTEETKKIVLGFSTKKKSVGQSIIFNIEMYRSYHSKCLGININNQLKWQSQATTVLTGDKREDFFLFF